VKRAVLLLAINATSNKLNAQETLDRDSPRASRSAKLGRRTNCNKRTGYGAS